MDIKKTYEELYTRVLEEHRRAFEIQDIGELERLMAAIVAADRIFVMGVGREGIAARAFAMRLMHLGKEVHWIWDDTTPGMAKGDLFIVVSGPGQIGHIHYVAEKGKAAGATLAVITGAPRQKTPMMADLTLFVPAQVYNGTDERCVPSVQPMGALFEQHCFVLFDIIIIMLEQSLKLDHAAMESRHRNIE
ncbi:MAG: SIS domain-containing protein [Clostridia bacterium]|nr:SIS domain-containing protein [Clostridia bacterium]